MKGRLSDEFRDRTKRYAANVIRLFIKLPKTREEARVLGTQLREEAQSKPERDGSAPASKRA